MSRAATYLRIGLVSASTIPVVVILIWNWQKPTDVEHGVWRPGSDDGSLVKDKQGLLQQLQEAEAEVDVEDPWYVVWAKYPLRTVVIQETVGEIDGLQSHVRSTHTLLEITNDKVVYETVRTTKEFGGPETKKVILKEIPRWVKVARGTTSADLRKPTGTIEEGTEDVTVCGMVVKAKWYERRFELNGVKVAGRMWLSDDFPVALKFVSRFTKTNDNEKSLPMTSHEELIEIKRP